MSEELIAYNKELKDWLKNRLDKCNPADNFIRDSLIELYNSL